MVVVMMMMMMMMMSWCRILCDAHKAYTTIQKQDSRKCLGEPVLQDTTGLLFRILPDFWCPVSIVSVANPLLQHKRRSMEVPLTGWIQILVFCGMVDFGLYRCGGRILYKVWCRMSLPAGFTNRFCHWDHPLDSYRTGFRKIAGKLPECEHSGTV